MVDALRIVIELKKVKADGLKVRQDNRAPIVGPSSITPFSRVRWLKHQFFLMLDIAKLRSIQYQDADNRISDPTDLAAKLPSNKSNLILIMSDMVRKRWRASICKDCSLQIQKAHMLCSLHTHLSCSAVSHCMLFRSCSGFPTLVLKQRSRFACKIRIICVGRAVQHMIRLGSMDLGIFASADKHRRQRQHA